MQTIQVINIKCGGCANTITKSIEGIGATNVKVDIANQTVSFTGDQREVSKKLTSLGYPPASSEAAKSILKKGLSYISCAIGKIL